MTLTVQQITAIIVPKILLVQVVQAVEQEQETVPLADQVLGKVMEATELGRELGTGKIEYA